MKRIKISEILPIDEKSSSASSWFLQQTTFNPAELKLRQGEEALLCKCESFIFSLFECFIFSYLKVLYFHVGKFYILIIWKFYIFIVGVSTVNSRSSATILPAWCFDFFMLESFIFSSFKSFIFSLLKVLYFHVWKFYIFMLESFMFEMLRVSHIFVLICCPPSLFCIADFS